MNILRIVYDWPEPWVGLSPAPYYLSKAQGEKGHKVYVLCGNLNFSTLKKFKFIEKPEANVVVFNLPRALTASTGPFLSTGPCAMIYYFLLRIFVKIDIVHGHGHMCLFFNIYKYLFGWLDKVPYVAHFHNNSIARARAAINNGETLSFMHRYFELPLHSLSDHLAIKVSDSAITVSEQNKKEFIEINNADANKITVIASGVPVSKLKDFEHSSKSKELIRMGCSAVVSERKGILELIDALVLLEKKIDYKFIWIGGFRENEKKFKNEVIEKIKNNNLQEKLQITGMVSNDQVFNYLKYIDYYIFPSKYEGLPKAVIEALAAGIPALVSGFKFSSEIKGVEYIESIEPLKFSEQLLKFVNQEHYVDRKEIANMFSWESRAEEVELIYNKVINKYSKHGL